MIFSIKEKSIILTQNNVLLAIATNIPVALMAGLVVLFFIRPIIIIIMKLLLLLNKKYN